MNLDPSLAFTALLECWPDYATGTDDGGGSIVAALGHAMTEVNPRDRYEFARGWIAATRRAAEVVDAEIADDLSPLATIAADLCRLADAAGRIAEHLTGEPPESPLARRDAYIGTWADTDVTRRNDR